MFRIEMEESLKQSLLMSLPVDIKKKKWREKVKVKWKEKEKWKKVAWKQMINHLPDNKNEIFEQ